mgnify:CR=1 FL=1
MKCAIRGLYVYITVAFLLLSPSYIFPQDTEEPYLELKPIVITKKIQEVTYTLFSSAIEEGRDEIEPSFFRFSSLDLQSRSPQGLMQSDFSLRGANFQDVAVLFNGRRINDPQTGHHNSDLPFTAYDLESVEVSPGSDYRYSIPDAAAGAVNFNTRVPYCNRNILKVSGGSHRMFSRLYSGARCFGETSALRLSVENKESVGYRPDTDYKKLTASLGYFLEVADSKLRADFGYQEKEFGAYDFYTPGLGYPSKEWTKTMLNAFSLDVLKENLLIRPQFLWRRHYDKFALDKDSLRSLYLTRHRTDSVSPGIYLEKESQRFGNTGFGAEYDEERINSSGLGRHARSWKSLYLNNRNNFSWRIRLESSLRVDDFNWHERQCYGSVGVNYLLTDKETLYFNAARNIRIPSFTELYYNDPVTQGNSGLKTEKVFSYEAGMSAGNGALSLKTAVFFRHEDDAIDWVKTSALQAKYEALNISEADYKGSESNLKLRLNNYAKVSANYTFTDRSSKEGLIYKYGAYYTKHLFNLSLITDSPRLNNVLGFTYKKKPGRDGWFIADCNFSYMAVKNLKVELNISNIFNVEYQEVEGIPQPGRLVEVVFKYDW